MLNGLGRLSLCVASGVAFLALTGCGGGQPDDGYAGPPPAAYDRGSSAPVLMGSTPSARPAADADAGLAGGLGAGMAPIPNPGDLSKAERVQYYGHKYDHLPEPKGPRAKGDAAAPAYPLIVRRRADGSLEISMRPIANPEDMSAAERRRVYGNRYAPRPTVGWSPRRLWSGDAAPKPAAKVAPSPKVAAAPAKPVVLKPVAAAPAKPVVAAPAPKPVAPLATAPVVAAASIAPAAAPAPKLTPGEQLSAAVRPEVMKGAVLTVPEGLAKGEESKVSLALPANLMDVIKREAAKLGLGGAAKKAEVSASLKGDGYEITPDGAQTQALKAGEATRLDWNVKPGAGDKAPLKATVDGTLTGDKKAQTTFSLASLEQAVAPVVEDAKAAAKGFKFPSLSLKSLAIPGMKPVTLPSIGTVQSEKLVAAGLALLALLLVIAMARNASAARGRSERRRKFRTMQDSGHLEPDHEPAHAPVSQPYVNPMIAAAGGAVVGAAVAHAAHDDHHGHDAHGHDSHAPDAHGHDAHAADGHHDDHGHAPDHGHGHDAHPVAHHAEPAHGHDGHGHDAHAPEAHAPDGHAHDDHGHAADGHAADHGHAAHPVAHHPEPAHGHDDHGHDAHAPEAHAPDAHAHDDHGHAAHGHAADHGHDAHPVAHHPEPAHGHDDHGHDAHAPEAHAPDAHAHDDHGHAAHGHAADHGHDAHPVAHHPEPAHGHDDHGHDAHAAEAHAPEAHGHDDHGHDAPGHGADHHHREPAHA